MSTSADIQPPPVQRPVAGTQLRLWGVYRSAFERFSRLQDGIVSRSAIPTGADWTLTEPSPLNTADVLRALFMMEARGIPHGWDSGGLLERLITRHFDGQDVQVTASVFWAAAIGRDRRCDGLYERLRDQMAGGYSQSMTLGWAISALCEYARIEGRRDEAVSLAKLLEGRLLSNQSRRSGLFRSSSRRQGLLRRRPAEASLSSQTYPILALATFARLSAGTEALHAAERCAARICGQQGRLGQWWWHYDVGTGQVADGYPIYCVNQDSAIPVALRSLQHAYGDSRFDEAIERGLLWELGENEVQESLVDSAEDVVARAVVRNGDGFSVDRELYSYQPARYIWSVLSDPDLASMVAP